MLTEAVCIPALRKMLWKQLSSTMSVKSRGQPVSRRSAAVPPWPTAPLWMPNIPLTSEAREGRQGASEQ